MTVYPDEVFFLNTLLDLFLLGTARLLSDCPKRRYRTVLAALFGGLYAGACAVVPLLSGIVFRLLAAVVLCLLAFGWGKAALRQSALFLLVCCGFGGMVLLAALLWKSKVRFFGGMPYYLLNQRLLLLLAGLLYSAVFLTMRHLCRHFGELVSVRLCVQGHCAQVTALCDTGNTLKDPLTAEPVIITDLQTAKKLFPQVGITRDDLRHPAGLMQRLCLLCPEAKPRLLPFRTVGEGGLLLGVRCDRIDINGKQTQQHILAFSSEAFSGEMTYQAITGGIYESGQTKNDPMALDVPPQGIGAVYRRKRYSAAAAYPCGGAGASAKDGAGR